MKNTQRDLQLANYRSQQRRKKAADIGKLPLCVNLELVEKMRTDLLLFLKECFPDTFTLEFDKAHIQYITELQRIMLGGGINKAIAMCRGVGKSSIANRSLIWAALYGHKPYSLMIYVSQDRMTEGFQSVKLELATNGYLLDYFPQVIFPIQCLRQKASVCTGQLYNGKPTLSKWEKELIVFPTIAGAAGSGSIIRVTSIGSGLRGMLKSVAPKAGKKSAQSNRVSFALLDDVSTQQSAHSPSQNRKLLQKIQSEVQLLGSSQTPISILYLGTVIAKNDLTQQICAKPAWKALKLPFLAVMPKNMKLWEQWRDIEEPEQAYSFYFANKQQMHQSAISNFPSKKQAITQQSLYFAMSQWKKSQETFYAQFQMAPKEQYQTASSNRLRQGFVLQHIGEFEKGVVRQGEKVYFQADVNKKALSYVVLAAAQDSYNVRVIEYGYYPEQGRKYTKLDDIKNTIELTYDGKDIGQKFYKCLSSLLQKIEARYKPQVYLVDSNWFQSTEAVIRIMGEYRQKTGRPCYQAKGAKPNDYGDTITRKSASDLMGTGWKLATIAGSIKIMHDPNVKKTLLNSKWRNGQITLYKDTKDNHLMFAQHMCSQFFRSKKTINKEFQQWSEVPGYENHFLDCMVLGLNAIQLNRSIKGIKEKKAAKSKNKQLIVKQETKTIIQNDISKPAVGVLKRRNSTLQM